LADLVGHGVVLLAGGHQGVQLFQLAFCLEDGLVGPGEVLIVADQGSQPRGHVAGFEHVVAHEVGEVAHSLQGDGLVE
jgi:hypothetical protein